MSNAAIYLNPEAFNTRTRTLMGRHAAGESFLRGYLRHSVGDDHTFWNVAGSPQAELEALIDSIEPNTKPSTWLSPGDRQGLTKVGVLNLPSPSVVRESWARRALGDTAYAICGITHTTADHQVMDSISNMLIAPVRPWDALICTSRAVRAAVEKQLEATEDYLTETIGASRLARPMLETIPLGVNVADFDTTPDQKSQWRERLGIADGTVVALYVGRFNPGGKMNPLPMALALERAAGLTHRKIAWVVAGWAPTEELTSRYHEESRACCPNVQYIPLDGREPDVRFSIWAVGDFFLSLSDNVQETFGLTPVEAMAAGMPNIVSDWDGYRDTVRHGVDGFRIHSFAPRPGTGQDLAYRYAHQFLAYDAYIGAASQTTVVDIDEAAKAIATLVDDPDLRARMGVSARARAETQFDWANIIPRYQALWGAMNERRLAEPPPAPPLRQVVANPWRMDPYTLFSAYPTEFLNGMTILAPRPGVSWDLVKQVTASSMTRQGAFAMATETEIRDLFETIASCDQVRVGELVATYPIHRRIRIQRSALWLAKYGFINISGSLDRVRD